MKHAMKLTTIYLKDKYLKKRINNAGGGAVYVDSLKTYVGKQILNTIDTNAFLKKKIEEGTPFCAARLGANELFSAGVFEFDVKSKQKKALEQLSLCAGFFPIDIPLGNKFNQCIKESCKQIDLIGISAPKFEDYYIRKFMSSQVYITRIFDLEPWKNATNPWTEALKGKKVLIIHPFADTIRKQYTKRKELFPNTNILPEFELKVLKAVQTVAGECDDRFDSWFDALEWMVNEAMSIDFDIAIIGCGAYGFPLAAKLKKNGKQAVHLGGATQILFGIKGKRWEEDSAFEYVQKFFNSSWTYPADEDKPKCASKVEGGCYW